MEPNSYIIIAGCLYFVLDLSHSTMGPCGLGPTSFQSFIARPQLSIWHIKVTSFYENHCILRNRVCLCKAILKYVFLQFLNRDL